MPTIESTITLRTTGAEGTTERVIVLANVPPDILNRVIHAAFNVSMEVGNGHVAAEEGNADAEAAVEELERAIAVLELCDGRYDAMSDAELQLAARTSANRATALLAHAGALQEERGLPT